MKHVYWLPLLLLAFTAQGQNFSPFHPGAMMQYSAAAGDSVRLLRLERRGAVGLPGQDSVYEFENRAAVPQGFGPTVPFFGCRARRGGSGPFGEALRITRSGTMQAEYTLQGNYNPSRYSYTFELLLKPRAPLNQVWAANSRGTTARVTGRTVIPVLGVPDSVVTIAFSNGQQMTLSKRYGLVESPVLAYFFTVGAAPRRQVLTALPGAGLDQAKLGARAIYDFQPGDRFVYSYDTYDSSIPSGPVRTNYLFADSILSRTTSRTGDTLTYRVLTCSQRGNGTSTVATVRYTSASGPGSRTSQQYVRRITPFGYDPRSGMMIYDAAQGTYATSRAVQRVFLGGVCPDTSKYEGPNIDLYMSASFATGLGCVYNLNYDHFGPIVSTTLVGYRKGTETWGQLPRLVCRPLATAPSRPAATTAAFPNPFGAELSVSFTLAHAQAVALTLHDGLGRVVLVRPAASLPGGAQQVLLPTADLPAGVYSLHLQFLGEARTEVLRVAKAH
jgi:hypothetical protein